jgi:hypothetical protein
MWALHDISFSFFTKALSFSVSVPRVAQSSSSALEACKFWAETSRRRNSFNQAIKELHSEFYSISMMSEVPHLSSDWLNSSISWPSKNKKSLKNQTQETLHLKFIFLFTLWQFFLSFCVLEIFTKKPQAWYGAQRHGSCLTPPRLWMTCLSYTKMLLHKPSTLS